MNTKDSISVTLREARLAFSLAERALQEHASRTLIIAILGELHSAAKRALEQAGSLPEREA